MGRHEDPFSRRSLKRDFEPHEGKLGHTVGFVENNPFENDPLTSKPFSS